MHLDAVSRALLHPKRMQVGEVLWCLRKGLLVVALDRHQMQGARDTQASQPGHACPGPLRERTKTPLVMLSRAP